MKHQTELRNASCLFYEVTSNTCIYAGKKFIDFAKVTSLDVIVVQFIAAGITLSSLSKLIKGTDNPIHYVTYTILGLSLYGVLEYSKHMQFVRTHDGLQKKLDDLRTLLEDSKKTHVQKY